ncbi:hypothetical protein V6N13_137419 [Hibiscus sabdariffa]|uniref:Uncharacterized protein n=1 Tax=Hibiscus sabdariffa TaxID=183260 RepID=A0ABR2DKQ7_9ROSI
MKVNPGAASTERAERQDRYPEFVTRGHGRRRHDPVSYYAGGSAAVVIRNQQVTKCSQGGGADRWEEIFEGAWMVRGETVGDGQEAEVRETAVKGVDVDGREETVVDEFGVDEGDMESGMAEKLR